MTNWNDIDDKMPESEFGEYIVCLKNNNVFMANYSTVTDRGFWHLEHGTFNIFNPVTHWMLKPEGANPE